MNESCQAILFDLDGVLIDSNPISERHWKAWADRHGLAYAEIARMHHGRPTAETMRQVAPHLDAAVEARVKETAEADDVDGLEPYAGVVELLARLPPQRWAVATSGTRRTAAFRFDHLGLTTPRVMVTADDVRRGKPAPDPYLLAAERLGVDPAQCVVVEDAPAGIAAAKAAGARVIGVTSTHRAEALAAADWIIDRFAELVVDVGPATLHVRRG